MLETLERALGDRSLEAAAADALVGTALHEDGRALDGLDDIRSFLRRDEAGKR
ncbi:hypothetical protein [Nonomuraea sp. NPDC003804]|uniref:hypothetical protein n=1 Tax=Nonomuraea sp. NPDC003804 TaxID=3154547 RepID=UPI00339E576E